MRLDLYHATQQAVDALDAANGAAARKQAAAQAGLSPEALRFLERNLRTFRRNGLHLPDAERSKARAGEHRSTDSKTLTTSARFSLSLVCVFVFSSSSVCAKR